jgi:DHA3 family tetracycline resistance protein-like MFS transporter
LTGFRQRPLQVSAIQVFVLLAFFSELIFSFIFTVDAVYQITVARLTPLQLVLVGTALELTVFVFEIPTGALADIKSRRLSIIVGYVLIGLGFIVQGALPHFGTVLLAQLIWGLGYTFTSGSTQAWIADEVGTELAGQAFLRGAQAGNLGGLVAVPLSVWIGTANPALPIVAGGAAALLLAVFLTLVMQETGFRPAPPGQRRTLLRMKETLVSARQLTRRQPVLLTLLGIAFFYGLYSEGLDRLWTPHLLQDVGLPAALAARPVLLFGAVRLVDLLLSLLVTELVRRREAAQSRPMGSQLRAMSLVIIVSLVCFGVTRTLGVALALYWLIMVLRRVHGPLQETWVNSNIDDPQVRATMFSALSQTDAIGQIGGGPMVGAIASRVSIRAALVVSGLLLSPVVPLYTQADRGSHAAGPTPDPTELRE